MARLICLLLFFCSFYGYATDYDSSHGSETDPFGEASNSLDILSGEPSNIVNHSVNVLTGDYIDMETDLELPGEDSLALKRFYCTSDESCEDPFRAWKFNHDITAYHPVKHFNP